MQNMSLLLLAALATSVAALWDTRTGRIPNFITFPVIGIAPLLHTSLGGLPFGLFSIAGMVACACVPGAIYRVTKGRAIGGGDVKLFSALGACLGATTGLEVQFLSYLLVSILALVQLTWHGRLLACLRNMARLAANPFLPRKWRRDVQPELLTMLRMGPAICVATLVVGGWQLAVA
jgi:prepilin peptidase CpaA